MLSTTLDPTPSYLFNQIDSEATQHSNYFVKKDFSTEKISDELYVPRMELAAMELYSENSGPYANGQSKRPSDTYKKMIPCEYCGSLCKN